MTRLDIKAIRARCEAATPGPWGHCQGDRVNDVFSTIPREVFRDVEDAEPTTAPCGDIGDAEFIAHARTDVPWLCEMLLEAAAIIDTLDDCMSVDRMEARPGYGGRIDAERNKARAWMARLGAK